MAWPGLVAPQGCRAVRTQQGNRQKAWCPSRHVTGPHLPPLENGCHPGLLVLCPLSPSPAPISHLSAAPSCRGSPDFLQLGQAGAQGSPGAVQGPWRSGIPPPHTLPMLTTLSPTGQCIDDD